MSAPSINLSEIVTVTFRNRIGALAENLQATNAFLANLIDHWEMQEAGTIPPPDFIRLSAEGKAKMIDGRVYLLKESTDGIKA